MLNRLAVRLKAEIGSDIVNPSAYAAVDRAEDDPEQAFAICAIASRPLSCSLVISL